MNTITKKQIRLIHVAKNQLGLDDDTYQTMMYSLFRRQSSKDLSYKEANEFIDHLKTCGFRVRRKDRDNAPNIIHLTSAAEHRLIGVLSKRFTWRCRDGFNMWLQHQRDNGHIKSVSLNERSDARWVIEKLKLMTGTKTGDIVRREVPNEVG